MSRLDRDCLEKMNILYGNVVLMWRLQLVSMDEMHEVHDGFMFAKGSPHKIWMKVLNDRI